MSEDREVFFRLAVGDGTRCRDLPITFLDRPAFLSVTLSAGMWTVSLRGLPGISRQINNAAATGDLIVTNTCVKQKNGNEDDGETYLTFFSKRPDGNWDQVNSGGSVFNSF